MPRTGRHIPSSETAVQDIRAFREELTAALEPSPDYDVSEWLFVPNRYCDWRFILGTRGVRPLICCGINPSTARPGALDPTLQSVNRIARGNGFDSFLMFNVYAQRATSPNDIESACNPVLHLQNMKAFDYLLSLSDRPTVWAAWGNVIGVRPYLKDCLSDMVSIAAEHRAQWVHCGPVSKKGHPHHPLYLKADSRLEAFDPASELAGM